MTCPLRIRPVPVMPIDCASRCNSGRSIADSRPDPLGPLGSAAAGLPGQERTAPVCSAEDPAAPDCANPSATAALAASSAGEGSCESANRLVLSVTRGPSSVLGYQ